MVSVVELSCVDNLAVLYFHAFVENCSLCLQSSSVSLWATVRTNAVRALDASAIEKRLPLRPKKSNSQQTEVWRERGARIAQ